MSKELIWVSEEFAKKYNKIQDENEQIKILEEYIKSLRKSFQDEYQTNIQMLEEDLIMLKALNLKVKQAFEKAKNEALDASYEIWEKYEEEIPKFNDKIKRLLRVLEPLSEKLEKINSLLSEINIRELQQLADLITRFSNMNEKEKRVFELLLKGGSYGN